MFMVDASQSLQAGDHEIYGLIRDKKRILLANKMDLAPAGAAAGIRQAFPGEAIHLVSAKNMENIEPIVGFLKSLWPQAGEASGDAVVNLRQKTLLGKLLQNLGQIERLRQQQPAPTEVIAEEIRQGLQRIGELTGAISSAEILQGIFARFCIGK